MARRPPEAAQRQTRSLLSEPVVDLGAGRAVGVEWRLVALLRLMEAEAVAPAVPGAVELLQQEDNGLVDDAQHPQPIDTCAGNKKRVDFSKESDRQLSVCR